MANGCDWWAKSESYCLSGKWITSKPGIYLPLLIVQYSIFFFFLLTSVELWLYVFLESFGDSKLTGRKDFRSDVGLAWALLGVQTGGTGSESCWGDSSLTGSGEKLNSFLCGSGVAPGDHTPVNETRDQVIHKDSTQKVNKKWNNNKYLNTSNK